MSEFQDVLISRRTIYRFSNREVGKETLDIIIDDAQMAQLVSEYEDEIGRAHV